MRIRAAVLVALFGQLWLVPRLAPQEEPAEATEQAGAPQSAFVERIEVKVVNVEVYVRDKKGNPVTGLTIEDFEIYENRRPVKITNFFEVAEGSRASVPEEAEEPTDKPDLATTHPEFEDRESRIPEQDRLHLIVYVDNFNIKPFNRNRVFRDLRNFLRTKMDREDRMMLVSYERSLHIRRLFTSDPALVTSALYELETHTGSRVQTESERRDVLRNIEEAEDANAVLGRVRLYAESVFNDLQFTLDALREMIDILGGIPGRKALVYVSEGLPMRAAEELFFALDDKFQHSAVMLDSLQYDASRKFRELTAQANANGVTFYTLDATGLRVDASRSAEHGYTDLSPMIDGVGMQNLQSTLLYMADRTGGQAVVNTNNIDGGLERFAQDFDHYYSLGYNPGHSGTGRYHKIDCKVKIKGLRVRCRDGYRDKPVETIMGDGTLATLQLGYQSNPLGIRIEPLEMLAREDGNYMVTLLVRIPIGNVVLIPFEEFHEGRVRLFVQALDQKGRISGVQENPVPIRVPNADVEVARGQYWGYEMKLLMRRGRQRLAVGARDDINARSSFVYRALSVGI